MASIGSVAIKNAKNFSRGSNDTAWENLARRGCERRKTGDKRLADETDLEITPFFEKLLRARGTQVFLH
jgi:hypothetical protein